MSNSDKAIAVLGILVGGVSSVLGLLAAFGVNISDGQQQAISSVAGLVLLIVSAWFHPSVPVGHQS